MISEDAPDFPTPDFYAGIACGLCGKVVSAGMNYDGFADNFFYCETFVIKNQPGIALASEEGRKIPRVVGMGKVIRIIVAACLFKIGGAISKFMDMHGIKIRGAFGLDIGKTKNFSFY